MLNRLQPIHDLVQRILPNFSAQFQIAIVSDPPKSSKINAKNDWFSLESLPNNGIFIQGNTSLSIISGFHWYLKHFCNLHLSWCGDRLAFSGPLPPVKDPVCLSTIHQYRVYMNYCTFNYSASWWDWARWEREIDFMALNGINMPLNIVGLEGTWYYSLLDLGFSDEEARVFLCGPAFLAWQYMTNIQSHGGPLPKSWIDHRIELGQKILQRERELGMTPILQGFSGYVPKITTTKFPKARINQQPAWCGFEGVFQLDPLDPLFERFGRVFLQKQLELFGSDHFYAADPFHEGSPPQKGFRYLQQVGKAIHHLLKSVDSQSIWVMQAWSLRRSIVKAVPKSDLLILDLNSSKWKLTFKFWGYPFVAGKLHNFGGRINLHGDLAALSLNPFYLIKQKAKNNRGMGLFMEGITQNPVYYDMAFDFIWRVTSSNPLEWISKYLMRRYGPNGSNYDQIALLFLKTAYCVGTDDVERSSIICARPALNVKKSGPNEGFLIPYDPHELEKLYQLLLEKIGEFSDSDGFRFDLVDIARQCLSNYAQRQYLNVKHAWDQSNLQLFQHETTKFMAILGDIDTLISTRPEYSLSKWIHDARACGGNESERNLYEYNAKMLITLWGPEKNPLIFDYSWREWAGLIRDFYIPRWQKFFDYLELILKNGKSYSERGLSQVYGREAWRANEFYTELAEWETNWVKYISNYSNTTKTDENEITIAQKLWKKYSSSF